jgi:hypothetical protein
MPCIGDCAEMSLRGSPVKRGTTEAISQHAVNTKIATLPRQGGIARNDGQGIPTLPSPLLAPV